MGGEVQGKPVNGVYSQYSVTVPRNIVYPVLLPTVETYDMLPSRIVSHELSSKIRALVSALLFPCNTLLTGIKREWPVETLGFQYYLLSLKSLHGVENAIETPVSIFSPYVSTLHKVLLLTHVASATLFYSFERGIVILTSDSVFMNLCTL
jgi:hypothetical protein